MLGKTKIDPRATAVTGVGASSAIATDKNAAQTVRAAMTRPKKVRTREWNLAAELEFEIVMTSSLMSLVGSSPAYLPEA